MKVGLKFVDERAFNRIKIDEKGDYIVKMTKFLYINIQNFQRIKI